MSENVCVKLQPISENLGDIYLVQYSHRVYDGRDKELTHHDHDRCQRASLRPQVGWEDLELELHPRVQGVGDEETAEHGTRRGQDGVFWWKNHRL